MSHVSLHITTCTLSQKEGPSAFATQQVALESVSDMSCFTYYLPYVHRHIQQKVPAREG